MNTQRENGETSYSFDLAELDGECRDILRAVRENGGVADSKFIKEHAAVDRNQLHYRYDKLERMGLINSFQDRPAGGGQKVKHAELTEEAQAEIETGLLEDITDANASLRQLKREVDELNEDVERRAMKGKTKRRLNFLRHDIEELQEELDGLEYGEDLAKIEDTLADVERRAANLDDRLGELDAALQRAQDNIEVAATESQLADSLDALNHRIEAVTQRVAEERTRDLAELDRDLTERLAALRDRVDGLPGGRRVKRIEDSLAELSEQVEHQNRAGTVAELEGEVKTLAERSKVRDLADRLDDLEELAEENAEATREHSTMLTRGPAEVPYPELPKGKRREYWLERAQERAEEIGCKHAEEPDKWLNESMLAHLDRYELERIKDEEIFLGRAARKAKFSTIPGTCKHPILARIFPFW